MAELAGNETGVYVPIESCSVYRDARKLADQIWAMTVEWEGFAKSTVGIQMVRAADSIAANLVEGDGRGQIKDGLRFWRIARGSARELRTWIEVASARGLTSNGQELMSQVESVGKQLSALISRRKTFIREQPSSYNSSPTEVEDDGPFRLNPLITQTPNPLL